MKAELCLSNYEIKADLKNAASVHTSKFAILKPNVDKLDIDKLKNVPSGLSSLENKVNKLDIEKSETTPF